MPEYLDDPSVLTKEKLKSELLAHSVELPAGNPTKDVYVQLYLKNLTAQNKKHATPAAAVDAFSSDEELPPPVVFSRSRSSGRKATRKTDKVRLDDLEVTELSSENLRDELLKYGVDAGPIVASTRMLYEKKLRKLLDGGPPQPLVPDVVLTKIDANHNGNSDSDRYSDKEEEEAPVPVPVAEPVPEPEPEPMPEPVPEPAPVAERPVRSRGKTPVTTRTRSSSSQHSMVEKITASEQILKAVERNILKEMFPTDLNSPTGISATCRRPIRGAAGRPVTPGDLWNNENFLSPKGNKTTTTSSSYTESRSVHRVTSLPPSTPSSSSSTSSSSSSSSRLLSAAPPTGQVKAARRSLSLWLKLFLLAIAAAFLFFIYQAMETNALNPFGGSDTEQTSSDSAAPVGSN